MINPPDSPGLPPIELVAMPATFVPVRAPEPGIHQMSFTGTGSEYFRIWIVNLALTVVTLGVYSAWAKVRRLQYFYRHTRLAGSGFDYHGDPIAILKGRFVGLLLFGMYSAISFVDFRVAIAILIALASIVPWLIARSLRFRLHNSSYRGIRFRFSGTVASAYWVFLGLPILTVLSLFLLGPFWHQRIKRYQFANAAYGRSPFTYRAAPGDFYAAYIIAFVVMMGFMFLLVLGTIILGVATAVANGSRPIDPNANPLTGAAVVIFVLGYAIAVVVVQSITNARIQNTVWNATQLGSHRFICEIAWFKLFGITFTNLLATVFTIGLFRPFAQVRLARYLTSQFVLVPSGSLDAMLADESDDVSAIGEEAAGFFDFDIGF